MSNQVQPETLQTLLAGFQNFSSLLQQVLTPNKSQLNHATETSGTANTTDIQGDNTATHRMPSIETPIMAQSLSDTPTPNMPSLPRTDEAFDETPMITPSPSRERHVQSSQHEEPPTSRVEGINNMHGDDRQPIHSLGDEFQRFIDCQSKMLQMLPQTQETSIVREEILRQIHIYESKLASFMKAQGENSIPENGVLIEKTYKTTKVSKVTTKGTKEITILLADNGSVLRDESGQKFFQMLYFYAEQIFGNTISLDWRNQEQSKKNMLFQSIVSEFGDPGFDRQFIMDVAQQFLHSKRDKLRTKLKEDIHIPRPSWITNPATWEELIKDAKFKRKIARNPNYVPRDGKRRLRDTSKATQARLASIGSHRLGSGGYHRIKGNMVNLFEREANEEDKIYAQKHGFQKLREKLVASGEKMTIQQDMEDSDSMSDENGQPTQCTETDGNEDEQSEEEQPHNDIQSEQVQPHVQQEMELPHDGLMHHSPIQTVHIGDAAMEKHEEPRHGGKRIKLRRLQDIRNIETPKSTKRNINKNKKKKVVSPEYQHV